jgi:NAD+ synthase
MLNLNELKIDSRKISDKIIEFIKFNVKKSGLNGGLIAVSGGIDSALILAYSVKALGSKRVHTITMPERDVTPSSDITDVMQLTKQYDVTCDVIDITSTLDSIRTSIPNFDDSNKITTGNIKPRLRMMISYYYANLLNFMVLGSSNKTELLTGYFTKYGDGGVDLMPLGDLYKCQIRQLAEFIGVPEDIIKKTPTAGLWPGQSDEDELGASYDLIDLILYGNELGYSSSAIAKKLNVDLALANRILSRFEQSDHKRRLPLILRLSSIT